MQARDRVRLFGNRLYLHFGATGVHRSATTMRLEQDLSFGRSGQSIRMHYHHSEGAITIDDFPSELLAETAHARVQGALQRFARRRQFADIGRRATIWIALPVAAFVALLLPVMLMRAAALTSSMSYPAAQTNVAPALTANVATFPPQPPAGVPAPGRDPAILAKAMADGVAAARFSIRFSNGPHGTLYVLSDPSCPHCRTLEPELERLSKDFTIHIFPVSVIGGQQSAKSVSALLCAPTEQRAILWRKLIAGTPQSQTACDGGSAARAANDRIFHALQLEGTPTIIDGAGRLVPDIIPNTAEAIGAWMRAAPSR